MATTVIDTLRYARRLRDAGVPPEQAEAMADAIGSELVESLATKADLDRSVGEINGKLDRAVAEIKGTILLLKWMNGFILAFVVAIAWRVFS